MRGKSSKRAPCLHSADHRLFRCSGPRNHRSIYAQAIPVPRHRAKDRRQYGPPTPDMAERVRRRREQHERTEILDRDRDGTPTWYKELKEAGDEESQALLDGADSDVDEVERRLRERDEMENDDEKDNPYNAMLQPKLGSKTPMRVIFRGFDPANAWFWLDLYDAPASRELEVIEETINSWFMLGRLGGFNAQNLQVQDAAVTDLSYQPYHHTHLQEEATGLYHDMGDIEVNGKTMRWRVDMGTGDELGLDVLLNALRTVSADYVGIKAISIGGEHADWPIPDEYQDEFEIQPLQSQEVYEQTEEEYWAKYEDELAERLAELREKHPEKVKELEKAEAEWRKTPEGQFQTAQENAQETLELREQGLAALRDDAAPGGGGKKRRAHHNPLYDFGADL